MRELEEAASEIARDNLAGAHSLALRALDALREAAARRTLARDAVVAAGAAFVRAQPAMGSLYNLFRELLRRLDAAPPDAPLAATLEETARLLAAEAARRQRLAASHIAREIPEGAVVLTHSSSETVRAGLVRAHEQGKRFSVICTESRPAREGAALAERLAAAGLTVWLTTDALPFSLMAGAAPAVDLVLVGADLVSPAGVVNKAGTLGFALAARSLSRPFYVAATSDKFVPASYPVERAIGEKPPEEILEAKPGGPRPLNRYFDITPLDALTAAISEEGLLPPASLASRLRRLEVSPELLTALGKS
jgi:translation initiation factor 2B subunit (eIF-2B alpha/beta/delta family)